MAEDEAQQDEPREAPGADASKEPEGADRGAPEEPAPGTPEPSEEDRYIADIRAHMAGPSLDYEAQMDVYPLRDRSEDPRWAVSIVWIWVAFASASLVFIIVLMVLGAVYD